MEQMTDNKNVIPNLFPDDRMIDFTIFNPFTNKPVFYVSAVQVLWKHWEKEKL